MISRQVCGWCRAVSDAYEKAARVAEEHDYDFEDLQEKVMADIADRIRALKPSGDGR